MVSSVFDLKDTTFQLDKQDQLSLSTFKFRIMIWVCPMFLTGMAASVSYPMYIRLAKKVFKVKSFFAIHAVIAPFMMMQNVFVFANTRGLASIKIFEEIKNKKVEAGIIKKTDYGEEYHKVRKAFKESKEFNKCQHQKQISTSNEVETMLSYSKTTSEPISQIFNYYNKRL